MPDVIMTVYVNSTSDISVYAINSEIGTKGMHVVYPTRTMGTHYMLAAYEPMFGTDFVVAALQDNTTVQVHLRVSDEGTCMGGLYTNGDVINVTLHSRQVWGGHCSEDFVGSFLRGDKPITVTAGLLCSSVPASVGFCDHMAEMMIPLEDLGNTYILHDIRYRNSGAIYRVISPYNNNNVSKSTGGSAILNQGEFKDYDTGRFSGTELCVQGSRPLLVLMFTKGRESDPLVPYGDPAMAVMPSVDRFASEYVVDMELNSEDDFRSYVAITVADGNEDGLLLSQATLPSFTSIGCGYSTGHVELNSTSHWLRHTSGVPFGAMIYVSGSDCGLATPAGMLLIDKYDHCLSQPCQNSATCYSDSDLATYNCTCATGYNGNECQINIDDCLPNPCTNGGSCIDGVDYYNCNCSSGYTGKYCETDIDECSSDPCQNEGTCVDDVNGYNCTCAEGYTGSHCERVEPAVTKSALETTSQQDTSTAVTANATQEIWMQTNTLTAETPKDPSTTKGDGKKCPCNCHLDTTSLTPEELKQQAKDQLEQIREELSVDKSKLSSTIRKVTSATDDRPSASGIGYVGVTFLFLSLGLILLMDLTAFCIEAERVTKEGKKRL